jgi:hypothetical protein
MNEQAIQRGMEAVTPINEQWTTNN